MGDELQQLWQQDNSLKEDNRMWIELVQEKRRGFEALVRVERQMEYLISLIFAPLCGVLAWKAKFPITQAGYAILAATLVGLAISLWFTGRERREPTDRTLREHLQALLGSYDCYVRFLRKARLWTTIGLVLGYLAVVFGVPRGRMGIGGYFVACAFLAGLCILQWRVYSRSTACLLAKRDEAERLLHGLG
jgi:hypothetical protein